MEALLKIITGALVGTSLMTLTSYFFANTTGKQFREPVLLFELLKRSALFGRPQVPVWVGWLLHYAVGIAFVIIYHFIWHLTGTDPTAISGFLLGLVSGLLGVFGWLLVFSVHSSAPSIDFISFYIQLIVVHLIFGLGATLGYLFFDKSC